jgi:S-adenosylmethionine decarboxylase
VSSIGKHYLVDLYGCPSKVISNVSFLKDMAIAAVKESKATVLEIKVRTFQPQGVTGFIMLAEGHLSFQSWPEFEYIAFDYFTCSNRVDPLVSINSIIDQLQPEFVDQKLYERGTRMDLEFDFKTTMP